MKLLKELKKLNLYLLIPMGFACLVYYAILSHQVMDHTLSVVSAIILGILTPIFYITLYFSGSRILNAQIGYYIFVITLFAIYTMQILSAGVREFAFIIFLYLMFLFVSYFNNIGFAFLVTLLYIAYQFFVTYAFVTESFIAVLLKGLFLLSSAWILYVNLRSAGVDTRSQIRTLERKDAVDLLYEISRMIAAEASADDILFKIATDIGLFTDLERSSIILVDPEMKEAQIAASFEGQHLRGLRINLRSYPEILQALKNEEIVTIDNLATSKTMKQVSGLPERIMDQSIMVIPISSGEERLGVLFLRGKRKKSGFSREEVKFAQTVATTSGQALLNSRLLEELDKKSEERMRMIEELENLNKELEDANRMKSVFVANVSHELRTPLTSIIGYLQLLEQSELFSMQGLGYMKTIVNNSNALLYLINGLIDISKIEAGIFDLFYEKHNLNEIIEYACERFKPDLDKEKMNLVLNLGKCDAEFYFDINRIEQVISNLIHNAIKFSTHGGKIWVKTSFAKGGAEISVKDEGIGIDEKEQELIFQRFMQVDSSQSREHEGVGIGLHLCKEIVERHGGEITVKSKLGKGSTFTFRVPMITNKDDLHKHLDANAPK
ncbi:MAG: GAF domain-containing sensor histidine kinase [Acidobacteria bacterium]|nr:GAF domain-containing sensor histidine kinase [Acidobacteriota bacterium]